MMFLARKFTAHPLPRLKQIFGEQGKGTIYRNSTPEASVFLEVHEVFPMLLFRHLDMQ